MDPGPLDNSVLYLQNRHRSRLIWDGEEYRHLHCRRRVAIINRTMALDRRIIPYLQQAGFYGLARVGFISLDWHLVTAFVERWRPETHTFHLPQGECTITLEDVGIQLGLPVDGLPVTGTSALDWPQICQDLLGFKPRPSDVRGSRLNLSRLAAHFPNLADDANEITVQQYARAYILQLIGGCLFSDKSNSLVHLMFLPLLKNFEVAGRYSWGSACLAWLYREMCRACDIDALEISGPLILLQLWAWDRFPHIAPHRLHKSQRDVGEDAEHSLPPPPLGIRWKDALSFVDVSTHALMQYRYQLDMQTQEQMIWQPYSPDIIRSLPDYCLNGRDIWRTVSPLICFHIVEWHRPDRVLRQFGLRQYVPKPCDTEVSLHDIDLRGRHDLDWRFQHPRHIDEWNHRREHIVNGEQEASPMDYHDPYMQWYRCITRRFISRRGAVFELMTNSLKQIHEIAASDAHLSGLSDIRTICRSAIKEIEEMRRQYAVPATTATPTSTPTRVESNAARATSRGKRSAGRKGHGSGIPSASPPPPPPTTTVVFPTIAAIDPLPNGSATQSQRHPSTQNQTQSQSQTKKGTTNDEKVEWDAKTIEIWVNICVEEVLAGNRLGTHFSELGWNNLMIKFTKATGKKYERSQHKSRWDTFKKKWQLWQSLVRGESGLRWDPIRQTVDASDEWWQAKIEKFPKVAAFRVKGLKHKDELDILFSDVGDIGRAAWLPSNALTTHMQTSEKDDNSASDEVQDDEDHTTANVNNEATPERPRKRTHIEISTNKRKNNSSKEKKLSNTLECVVDAVDNSTTQSIRVNRHVCSIREIMQLVEEIPGVIRGDELYMFAAQLFLKRQNREMFEVLTEPNIRLAWLQSMEQQRLSSSSNRGGHL